MPGRFKRSSNGNGKGRKGTAAHKAGFRFDRHGGGRKTGTFERMIRGGGRR